MDTNAQQALKLQREKGNPPASPISYTSFSPVLSPQQASFSVCARAPNSFGFPLCGKKYRQLPPSRPLDVLPVVHLHVP